MPETFDHSQPSSLEAEKALLGSVLLDAHEALPLVLETRLTPKDFYKEAHGFIFESIVDLYNKSEPIDLVTISNALKSKGSLETVGGAAYISDLVDTVGVAANSAHYAKIIIDRAVLRRLISISGTITEECLGSSQAVDDVLDRAESAIYSVRDQRASQGLVHVPRLLPEAFARISTLTDKSGGLTGIPTGYSDLDSLTGGFQRSDLIILAGRPSMGKTAMALNLALGAALPTLRQGHRNLPQEAVAIFSLEMSTEQLLQRLMCQVGKLNLGDLRTGKLQADDFQKLTTALSLLEKADLYIDDTPAIRVLELRAKARRLNSQLNSQGRSLGLVVIDYLQLMRGNAKTDSREQEISEISRGLKSLAKELSVPIIALSQLNRKLEERSDKKPMLSDLRESGAIEQDADLIGFVYRPEVYNPENDDLRGKAELIIGKHRNGPTGAINLLFQHSYSCFVPGETFNDF